MWSLHFGANWLRTWPVAKRKHGYYMRPFLLDGAFVARVDLKADRKNGILMVQRLHIEAGAPGNTRDLLLNELRLMVSWRNLTDTPLISHRP